MFRAILIPLDGSSLAEQALPYAEALARPTGARLLLVQAAWVGGLPEENWGNDLQNAAGDAERYLKSIAERLSEQGLKVETAAPYGVAATMILDEVRTREADLIVMATHGRSGLGRWLYGSVAEAVLARSPVPVLLVRAWQDGKSPIIGDSPRLLVPLDGSRFAEAVLPLAESLAKTFAGRLVLMRAVRPPDRAVFDVEGRMVATIDQESQRVVDDSRDYLRRVAERLPTELGAVEVDVHLGDPAEAITAAARERGAALVVMATHGRTGISRLILGSVAGAVLRHGNGPLLLVRPAGPTQQEAEDANSEAQLTQGGGSKTKHGKSSLVSSEQPEPRSSWTLDLVESPLVVATPLRSALERPARSPVEQLLDAFEAHAAAEAESLTAYRRLADSSQDSAVKLLMRLVVEDEERHHGLLERMAASLRDDLYWTHSPDALPVRPLAMEPSAPQLIATTRTRLREERDGVHHFRQLARQQKGIHDGLFELLLEVMAMDSKKHERILQFILRRLERTR